MKKTTFLIRNNKTMANKALILLSLIVFINKSQAQQTFSVFTYTEPKDFKKELGKGTVTYTITDNKKGTYCKIALLGAITSKGSLQKDFDSEWNINVVKNYSVTGHPQTEEPESVDGWAIKTGVQNFSFKGGTSLAMLNTFVGFNKTAGVLVFMNDQSYQPIVTDFFEKLSLNKPQNTTAPQKSNTTPVNQEPSNTSYSISLNDYAFDIPTNWKTENRGNEIFVTDERESFKVSILPPFTASGSLETEMNNGFFKEFNSWEEVDNFQQFDHNEKGKTVQGFDYYMLQKTLQMKGNKYERACGTLLLIQLGNKMVQIVHFKSSANFNVEELNYMLYSLRFKNVPDAAISLHNDIIGGWSSVGGSTSLVIKYYKDGSFVKGGAAQTTTSHDANYDRVTTTSHGATGTYKLAGNNLSTYYNSNGETYHEKIRFYYRKIGNENWTPKLGYTGNGATRPFQFAGELDKD